MKTPDLIAREAMDKHYGIGTDWEEPNQYGEEGFTRAQAETEIDADTILGIIREAIEADRAQRPETPAYKVGDPDPTPSFDAVNESFCDAGTKEGVQFWACTWAPNHSGTPHVAGDGEIICAVWR